MSENNKKSPATFSRRRLLGCASAAPLMWMSRPPAMALLSAVLGGEMEKAWAQSLGLQPRAFVRILEGGAPARYMYDSFLTPYSTGTFNRNPMVCTQFAQVNGRYVGGEYVTHSRHGIQVPTMWTHDIPTPGGGSRPMSDLLTNLLCIQGITTRNAGHEASQLWAWTPPGSKQSSSALSGDAADVPFAGINLGASSYNYKSNASKTSLSPTLSGNWISSLLAPFQPVGTTQFRANKDAIRSAYRGILPSIDRLARQGHVGAEALMDNRDSAFSLFETNFTALDTQWNALRAKYQTLIDRALFGSAQSLAGFNDLPIGDGGNGQPALYNVNDATNTLALHTATDVRSVIGATTNVTGLAERFAFTEYVLINNLSFSIAFSIGSINGLVRQSDANATLSMFNDQHQTGLYPSTYINMMRHRAGATCLMELISALRTANKFNDTVICLSGEFNRNPRADSTGSDHGFNGTSQAFYCGAFNGPLIVGNLRNDARMSWGAGGIIPQLGRQLNLVDSMVTIAHLLRVGAPFTSTTPIVTLGSNGLASNIGTTLHV